MIEQLKTDFERFFNSKKTIENLDLRKENLEYFLKQGFPNKKNEDWKYSDLNSIISLNFEKLNFFYDDEVQKNPDIKYIDDIDCNKLILINGKIAEINFDQVDKQNIIILNDNKSDFSLENKNPLIYLNNALTQNVVKILIESNYQVKKPIVIYHLLSENLKSTLLNQKVEIVLGENSQSRIVNIFQENNNKNFINSTSKILLARSAILKNYKLDISYNNNIKYLFDKIELDENSNFENFIFSQGSKFIKNEIECDLKGKHSSAFINGILNLDKSNHHEIKTRINHISESTKSYQLIKNVLKDESKGVFQGKIFVNKKAQKTDGYQLSKVLLVDKNTEFDAKPELEIYADDVKCSHGSTSGNIDENSIFYLMSRGLSRVQAKQLIIEGFLLEVVEQITDSEIKKFVEKQII